MGPRRRTFFSQIDKEPGGWKLLVLSESSTGIKMRIHTKYFKQLDSVEVIREDRPQNLYTTQTEIAFGW